MKLFHLATCFVYAAAAMDCNEFGCGNSYTKFPDGKSTYGFDDGGCFYCSEPGSMVPLAGGSLSDQCKKMCEADTRCVAYQVGRPAAMPAQQYFHGKPSNCCLEHRRYPSQAFVDATIEKMTNTTCQLDVSCWTRYEKNETRGQEDSSSGVGRSKLDRIKPIADSYVRDGPHSATNYGAELTLPVKSAPVGWTRISLLQFNSNLLTLSGGRKAKLRLYVVWVDPDTSRTISVARMPKTFALNEETTAWQNTPFDNVQFGSSTLTISPDQKNQWVEVDITDLLVDGERMVLALDNRGQATAGNLVAFASKESVAGPRVVFEDNDAPPTPLPSGQCRVAWDEETYSDEEIREKIDFIAGGCDHGDETFRSMLAEAHQQCLAEVIADSMSATIIGGPAESMSVTIIGGPITTYTYANVAWS